MTVAFDYDQLRLALGPLATRFDVDHLDACASTNTELLSRAQAGAGSGTVVVAATQSAGRGRRGRTWVSTPGDSLTFSLLWRFDDARALAGLSLGIGIAIARALTSLGVADVWLKWPNDIWLAGRKLGGVLVESSLTGERAAVVIGIGLNLRRSAALDAVDQPVAALDDAGSPPSREVLLAVLLSQLALVLDLFERHGFAPFHEEWQDLHALQERPVRLVDDERVLRGICRGVDEHGALLLDTEAGMLRLLGGELSLREDPCTS
ncbi:biotin--[acetyl-CoA-carboxylase] ligase [Uliginosibacterium sp. H1]|uniref:biotin--[acetyl-CoA-carboxylase] ligase n=1 Tax=Uliginosibacterium sp. H1 TaxID=3114757 RepID=UPI002E16F7B1|nr:biotin--[acetyl-CoA-carboxylase] ligase [Uliginosibacterium sp. H1]